MTKTIEQELEFEMLVRFAINIYEFETEKTKYERAKKINSKKLNNNEGESKK